MMHTIRMFAAGLLALLLAACGTQNQGGDEAGGSDFVVMNSYVAEIFVALGAVEEIRATGGGVDHIAELANTPRLPGFRQSSAESVLAFKPRTVISTADILDPNVANQLRGAGVNVVLLPDDPSVGGVEHRIGAVARLLGREQAGRDLLTRFKADLAEAEAFAARTAASAAAKPRGLFILSGGRRPTLVAGKGTGPANLITMAGGENVATGFDGFKVMSQEAMVAAAPEFFLVNKDGLEVKDGVPVALAAPGARLTPAGRKSNLITIPGEFLQGFGLRTPDAIRALTKALYPQAPGARPVDDK